jgi:hypothetical protein
LINRAENWYLPCMPLARSGDPSPGQPVQEGKADLGRSCAHRVALKQRVVRRRRIIFILFPVAGQAGDAFGDRAPPSVVVVIAVKFAIGDIVAL